MSMKNENYLGLISQPVCRDAAIESDVFSGSYLYALPTIATIWNRTECFPCYVFWNSFTHYLPYEHTLKVLEEFGNKIDNDIIKYVKSRLSGKVPTIQLHQIDDNIFVSLGIGYSIKTMNLIFEDAEKHRNTEMPKYAFSQLKFYYYPNSEDKVNSILKRLQEFAMIKDKETIRSIDIICAETYEDTSDEGWYLEQMEIRNPKIKDLKLHYGQEFIKTHETIMNALNKENSSGLILLHGIPGSGKTSYLRHLIHNVDDKKRFIYLPNSMVERISNPEFISFMVGQGNSILLIEDAENIIKNRSDNNSKTQAVANLLNITDGLLGDCLNQIVIATFNCDLSSIDPALLRKGRLICQHEFGKIDVEHAQKLSNELGFKTTITEPMALCDIYGQDKL